MTPPTGISPQGHQTGPFLEPVRLAVRAGLAKLPGPVAEFLLFGFKMVWACLFGALMLCLLILTHVVWDEQWPLARYDFLFLAALTIQCGLLLLKMETLEEARVIALYHVVGTMMEVFKTHVGSWVYPEDALIRIAGVPLFSGFMYACVGSFIARALRIFDMRFSRYPPAWTTWVLAVAVYVNFFSHHYAPDLRWVLFAATLVLFGRTRIWFTIDLVPRWMPLVLAALLAGVFLWVAENIGTFTGAWLYPGQEVWKPVSLAKFGSWYLLLWVSFVLVTFVAPPRQPDAGSGGGGKAATALRQP